MKRLSPLLIVGALLAAAIAFLRGSVRRGEPDSNWQPVEPS